MYKLSDPEWLNFVTRVVDLLESYLKPATVMSITMMSIIDHFAKMSSQTKIFPLRVQDTTDGGRNQSARVMSCFV